eukprot:2975977-Lingulodinium_polyedra.AAC.1
MTATTTRSRPGTRAALPAPPPTARCRRAPGQEPETGLMAGGYRPLQIPTCRKRCLGAYWAAMVGPA